MGLLNDVRFYLIVALAILFLIVMAMCSSAYDTGEDRHANAGVEHSDGQMDAKDSEQVAEESEATTEGETQALISNTETAETKVEEVVAATEETTESTDAAAEETEAVTEEAANDQATDASAEATETEEVAQADVASTPETLVEVSPFKLSPLADSGEMLPDLQTDIENLKGDFGRFNGRVADATGMFDKVKEAMSK